MRWIVFPAAFGLGVIIEALRRSKGDVMGHYPPARVEDWRGWVWPVPIWKGREPVRSDFFQRVQDQEHRKHLGLDIMFRKIEGDPPFPYSSKRFTSQGEGVPIVAIGPGKVWEAGPGKRGLNILIDHGKHLGGMVSWYQHLKTFSRPWRKGDLVQAGTILGTMGGNPEAGGYSLYHLHFEMRFPRGNVRRELWVTDPEPYLRFMKKIPPSQILYPL